MDVNCGCKWVNCSRDMLVIELKDTCKSCRCYKNILLSTNDKRNLCSLLRTKGVTHKNELYFVHKKNPITGIHEVTPRDEEEEIQHLKIKTES